MDCGWRYASDRLSDGAWYLPHKKGRRGTASEYRGRTSEEVSTDSARWIESEYEVMRIQSFTLGCSPKVPRGLHEKADVLAQKSWKKGGLVSPLPERE